MEFLLWCLGRSPFPLDSNRVLGWPLCLWFPNDFARAKDGYFDAGSGLLSGSNALLPIALINSYFGHNRNERNGRLTGRIILVGLLAFQISGTTLSAVDG